MYCRFCDAFVGLGNQHECPKEPVRKLSYLPPQQLLHWTIAGCGIIAGVLVSLAVSVAQMIELRQIHSTTAKLHGIIEYNKVASLVSLGQRADDLGDWVIVVALACIAGYAFWFRAARQMVTRFGNDGKQALAHWTYLVWRISVLAAATLTFGLSTGRHKPTNIAETITDLKTRTQDGLILDAARALTGLLLIAALVVVMQKMWTLSRPVDERAAEPAV
jgi:hypothetical protein